MKGAKINQKGHSLAETVGVLIIIAILSVGFFGLYSKAISKAQANSGSNISHFEHSPNITFGPYSAEQIFFDKDQANAFLGEQCARDFSCTRSFCGQFEIKNKNEIYLRTKDWEHCLSNMIKYQNL